MTVSYALQHVSAHVIWVEGFVDHRGPDSYDCDESHAKVIVVDKPAKSIVNLGQKSWKIVQQ